MSTPTREDDILRAVQEYQEAAESGRRPDRADFLAKHADLAGDLVSYLDVLDALQAAVLPGLLGSSAGESALPAGTPLGDFQIIREIGRGGMGVVYEAEQLSLGRHVALKVLPFAAALDSRQLQRFKNEAQAAAGLHHSNIVPVYAVGSDRSVHFYAMQLIDGRSLAELIAALRRRRDPAGEESPPARPSAETAALGETREEDSPLGQGADYYRNVARLMAQAASALEHAHQQGVIHRDIKPANLLVDARGHLWVTDFGLAHVQAGVDLTRTGDLLGTLRYMSSEQASGQRVLLDQRTDLYSLGATFYELCTLEPLFPGHNRPALLRQIVSEEPRPPRAVARGVPVELETILLKCLQKVPADRYSTAQDLADDLERFLHNRPIQARRPGLLERGRKWARRHPGAVAGMGLIFLVATAGLLVNQALLAREQGRTQLALAREKQRAEEAERHLQQARQLVNLLLQVAEEDLDDKPTNQALRRRLLETALAHYQLLAQESSSDAAADLEEPRQRARRILAELIVLQGAEHTFLLNHEAVLKELDLTEPQKENVRELLSKLHRARMETERDPSLRPAQRRQRHLEAARDSKKRVAALLTASQKVRLAQLALQTKGMLAFRDPEVLAALRLSPGQRQRIREIEQEMFSPDWGRPGPGGFGPSPWERGRDAVQRCLALLTPEQRTKWDAMTGKPFQLPMPPFFGPKPFAPPPLPGPRGP